MTMKALDISFGSALAVEDPARFRLWCEARKANGDAEALVVCLWKGNGTPLGAEEALRIAREAGLLTAGYCAVHDGRTGEEHVLKAIEGAGLEWPELRFMAVDCEEIGGVALSPHTIASALEAVERAGGTPMIYTRASYWREHQGNTDQFASYPLWEAFYDGGANLHGAAWLGIPFGGFAEPAGKQYLGSHGLDGVTVDANVFLRSFIGGKTMPELTPDIANALDVVRGWSNPETESLWGLQRKLIRLEHRLEATGLENALRQLQDASRVLDEAFGVGQQ